MPAIALIAPITLKNLLLRYAFDVASEDDYNWVLVRGGGEAPVELLTIPKKGKKVSMEIMERALQVAKMDNTTYFRLLGEVEPKITSASVPVE